MERIPFVKINENILLNPKSINSIRYSERTEVWSVLNGDEHWKGIELTNEEFDKLKQFLVILEKPEDAIFMDLSDDVDNFATDLWGGAGPDCISKRLVAAYLN